MFCLQSDPVDPTLRTLTVFPKVEAQRPRSPEVPALTSLWPQPPLVQLLGPVCLLPTCLEPTPRSSCPSKGPSTPPGQLKAHAPASSPRTPGLSL